MIRTAFTLLAMALSTPVGAALAKHSSVTQDAAGNILEYIETVADSDGNLRIETYGVQATATSSENLAGGNIKTQFSRGSLNDLSIFQAKEKKTVMVDGTRCQSMSPDSPPPPGMPTGGMEQYQEHLKAAQAQIEELAKTNPEAAKMLENMGITGAAGAAPLKPKDDLTLVPNGENRTVNGYPTTGFDVIATATKTKEQTVWAAKKSRVQGADLITRGMSGMYAAYKAYMDRMGAGSMADSNMLALIIDKLQDYYPLLVEDHTDNTQTTLTSIHGTGSAEFYPQCTEM